MIMPLGASMINYYKKNLHGKIKQPSFAHSMCQFLWLSTMKIRDHPFCSNATYAKWPSWMNTLTQRIIKCTIRMRYRKFFKINQFNNFKAPYTETSFESRDFINTFLVSLNSQRSSTSLSSSGTTSIVLQPAQKDKKQTTIIRERMHNKILMTMTNIIIMIISSVIAK